MAQERIMLIEDDPAVAAGLQEGLGREGYVVAWHSLGQAGIAAVPDFAPHLIILDVRLPDGSGFDVCRQLRQESHNQPILFLTVQGDELDKVLGLEMGGDGYMTKPYSLRELIAQVRALLRRAYGPLSGQESNQIFLNDLVIHLDQNRVSRGEVNLNLTPTEFKLLLYLARHQGQALSRSQILEGVWGYDDVESERTVNVHIRRLREKIEIEPSSPRLILTVPGVGYRAVAGSN